MRVCWKVVLVEKINVLNIQRYSIHDGPGVRTTVFLKGCPLRCLWCANPESQKTGIELMYDEKLCMQCRRCVETCVNGAIIWRDSRIELQRGDCVACGACAEACPTEALEMAGKSMSYEDVYKEAVKDEMFYRKSGGGVTITGGEPTLHMDFLEYMSRRCRENGIHISVETCGYCDEESIIKIGRLFDFIFFDIKQLDDRKHTTLTSGSNRKILANVRTLIERYYTDGNIVLRYPFIPGCNDSDEDMSALVIFWKSLNRNVKIEVLPYHRLGIAKYKKLGREYKLQDAMPPRKERLSEIDRILTDAGVFFDIII